MNNTNYNNHKTNNMIKLTYFPNESLNPINLVFRQFISLTDYLNIVYSRNIENGLNYVYLVTYSSNDDDVENTRFIAVDEGLDLIAEIIRKNDFDVFDEWHLHEYSSYEDAYVAALNLREGNGLCYSNN